MQRPVPLVIDSTALLANDTDADGDPIFSVSGGETNGATDAGGTVSLPSSSIRYVLPPPMALRQMALITG